MATVDVKAYKFRLLRIALGYATVLAGVAVLLNKLKPDIGAMAVAPNV